MTTKRKPRPGSLPLSEKAKVVDPSHQEFSSQDVFPPFFNEQDVEQWQRAQSAHDHALTGLRKARAKVEELAGAVRNAAFEEWVRRCVTPAQKPSEWTQAQVLYENYLANAKNYGRNRSQRALSVQELVTQTQWGRMMATVFPKKRRTAGWYYPLRCKRDR